MSTIQSAIEKYFLNNLYAEKNLDTVALGTSLGVLTLIATVIAGLVVFMKKRR